MALSPRQQTDILETSLLAPEGFAPEQFVTPDDFIPPVSLLNSGWPSELQVGARFPTFDRVTVIDAPANPSDAVRKDYVDTNFMNLNGGTLTAALTIAASAPDQPPGTPDPQGPKLFIHSTGTGTLVPWPGIEMNTDGAGSPSTGAAGYINTNRRGLSRWTVEIGGSDVESGGNVGTNFGIRPFTDAGAPLGMIFRLTRVGTGFWDGTTFTFGQGAKNLLALSPGAAPASPVVLAPSGAGGLQFTGNIGFIGATPVARQVLTGSKAGNAALASVIAALVAFGLATDTTTA